MIRRFLTATALLAALSASTVWIIVRMPTLAPIGQPAAERALAYVRARLTDATIPELVSSDSPQAGLPVIVTLYRQGRAVARAEGLGATFGAAVKVATGALVARHEPIQEGDRLQLDRVVAKGYLSSQVLPLLALGTVPIVDGVGASGGGQTRFLTVTDLLSADVWAAYRPVAAGDFSIGMNAPKVLRLLDRALSSGKREAIFRFRAETALEGAPPERATPPTRAEIEAGARAAGSYLARHLQPSGRFDYEHYTSAEGAGHGDDYSLARHAGAASYLAQMLALDPTLKDAAIVAIDHLTTQRPAACQAPGVSVGEPSAMGLDLGTSALSMIAALEYERTTSDRRYHTFISGLADYLFSMQRSDGEFCHLYDCVKGQRDERTELLFFSGEATYALALYAKCSQGATAQRAWNAVDHALRYLTFVAYDHFAGQFFMGEEHWTCIALDAAWDGLPASSRERYAQFCDEFARFSRRLQFLPGSSLVAAQPQLAGAYGIGAQVAVAATPIGSRSESLVAIERVARRRGLSSEDPRVHDPHEQLLSGLGYLLRHQIDGRRDPLIGDVEAARGGFLLSEVERRVRIDTVQHAGSALLGSLSLL